MNGCSSKTTVNKSDGDKFKTVSSGLNNLKSKVNKSHLDKLALVPVDLKKFSDVVGNVVKKTM